MEGELREGFSEKVVQLAERYKVGQPVAMYERKEIYLYVKYIRIKVPLYVPGFLFGFSLILLVLTLVLSLFFAFQRTASQLDGAFMPLLTDVYSRLSNGIFNSIYSTISCGASFVMLYIYIQNIPEAVVICDEGMLMVWPRKEEATYWNEVTSIIQMGDNRYKIGRNKRKEVYINDIYNNMDDIELIRKRCDRMKGKQERRSERDHGKKTSVGSE